MKESFVYVIAKKGQQFTESPVKIGIANNPWERVRELSTASPFKIEVDQTFKLPRRQLALRIEQEFHRTMKPFRLHGEWFDMSPGDAIQGVVDVICHHMQEYELYDADAASKFVAWSYYAK